MSKHHTEILTQQEKDQTKLDQRLEKERQERYNMEKEFQSKLEDLQNKMEQCLRQREKELREEHDAKAKLIKNKYQGELEKAQEMYKEKEEELDQCTQKLETVQQYKSELEMEKQK